MKQKKKKQKKYCEHRIGSAERNFESVNVDKINCIKVADTRLWWLAAFACNVQNWSVNIVSLISLPLIPGNLSSYYILRPFHSSTHHIVHIFGILQSPCHPTPTNSFPALFSIFYSLSLSLQSWLLALCQSVIFPILYVIYISVWVCLKCLPSTQQRIDGWWRKV